MQAKLIEWTELAPGVRNFIFEAVGIAKLDFTPGQFVSFSDHVNGRIITRAYSIASASRRRQSLRAVPERSRGRRVHAAFVQTYPR